MDDPLNVLILEDNPADAELAAEELRKAGLSIQWQRVQTERDYLAALHSKLDIILADHSLPQYDSVRALDALKQRNLDVPFVVVSGSIDEELAVMLMKRGAADYVIKDRLARLGQAVAHALQERKVRLEKRQAEQSLVLFRALLDRTNDAIEIIDPATGRFLDVNDRACTTYGYTRAEYLNLTVLDVEATITEWPPKALKDAQQTDSYIVQGIHRRKDGMTFPVEINVNYIRLERDYVVAVVRDVTEREQAEASLRATEERFRRITVHMLDMVSQTDAAGIVQYATPSNQQVFGYPMEEFIGKSTFTYLHPDDCERALAMFQNALATLTPGGGEFRFRHKDGHYLWLEVRGNILIGDDGKACGTVLASRDITERKRRDEQVRLQVAALEAAANSIVITDRKGDIAWVNPAYTRMTGYALDEVRGKNPRVLKSGKHDPEFYQNLWNTILAENVWHGEVVNRRKDGTLYFEEMTITPVCAGGNEITHFVAIKQDITERKRTEESLRASEKRFELAVEGANDGVWDWNLASSELYFSPRFKSMLGYEDHELDANFEAWQARLHSDDRAATLAQLRDYMEGRSPIYQPEYRLQCKDGTYRWFQSRATAVRDTDGKPTRLTGALTDITRRKQAEDELRKINAELEQRVRNRTTELEAANKEMEAFAYSVSHDLRAPLRAIDGFSLALLEDFNDKLNAEGQDCLRRVRAATQRMGHLIDDILQLSRMTRSAMTRETVDLSAIAARVVAELHAAEPNRHDVCFHIHPGLVGEGDSRLLEVVLTNLLGNAWKFTSKTENARIEFGATVRDGQRVFFVRDNGAGFDMANADRLFGAFQRLHTDAEFPGTGIGLATVQRIIRRHGGQVWAEGSIGFGATFSFSLGPIGRAP